MNIIRIKTGYGSPSLIGITTTPNTDLYVYFNDAAILVRTNENGKYFFNEKHKPLPVGCMVYENVSISSTSSEPIVPMYGTIDRYNICHSEKMEILIVDTNTHSVTSTIASIDGGRISIKSSANVGSKMSYSGVV